MNNIQPLHQTLTRASDFIRASDFYRLSGVGLSPRGGKHTPQKYRFKTDFHRPVAIFCSRCRSRAFSFDF